MTIGGGITNTGSLIARLGLARRAFLLVLGEDLRLTISAIQMTRTDFFFECAAARQTRIADPDRGPGSRTRIADPDADRTRMGANGFELRSGDAGALATLMYSLGDLTKTLAVRFGPEGLEAQEKVCQDCVLLSVRLQTEKFRRFRVWGSGGVLLKPDDFYVILSQAGQRDEVELSYDDSRDTLLRVQIFHENEDLTDQTYELRLLRYEPRDLFEAPRISMDYVLAVSSAYLTNSFSRLLSFGNSEVMVLACDRDKLSISARGDHLIHSATFTVFTGPCSEERASQRVRKRAEAPGGAPEANFTRSVKQESVEYRVLMRHVRSLIKAFGINRGSTFVYLRKDYPLLFELHVGALGSLTITLLPMIDE
jgi:hypothetical protein